MIHGAAFDVTDPLAGIEGIEDVEGTLFLSILFDAFE
jgi:hypothetical protein